MKSEAVLRFAALTLTVKCMSIVNLSATAELQRVLLELQIT